MIRPVCPICGGEPVMETRDMWRDRALNEYTRADGLMEAAKRLHAHCDAMELTALEAVYTAREVARVYTAVMDGTTAIGGAQ